MRKIFYTFCLLSALSPAQMLAYTPAGLDPLPTFGSVIYQVLGGTWSAAMERFSLQWWDASQDTAENQGSVLAVTPTPTGNPIQSFCDAATVADLVAIPDTGGMIDWYDAATGGNLLNATDVLADGDLVFAEQTIGGVPSADRLQVLVHLISTETVIIEICEGDSIEISSRGYNPLIPNSFFIGFYDNFFFYRNDLPLVFDAAEDYAQIYGGHLASIHSTEENELIQLGQPSNLRVTIGIRDNLVFNNYYWTDNTPVDFLNFGPGEPSTIPGEDYVQLLTFNGFWIDRAGGFAEPSIIKIPNSFFSLSWSNGETTESILVTPASSTTYSLTIELNGLLCQRDYVINVNPRPSAPISNGDPRC